MNSSLVSYRNRSFERLWKEFDSMEEIPLLCSHLQMYNERIIRV